MRFEREANILAALNHPHIAHIHGLEESGDVRALVLELVDGPTLADRIAQGSIPIDDALEAAHEEGIIHREVKPVNSCCRTQFERGGVVCGERAFPSPECHTVDPPSIALILNWKGRPSQERGQ